MTKRLAVSAEIRAQDRVTRTVGKIRRAFQRLTGPVRRIGNLLRRIARATGLTRVARAIARIGRAALRASFRLAKMGLGLAALVAGIGGLGIGAVITRFANWGDQIGKTAKQLALSVVSLQQLGFAADREGVPMGAFNQSLRVLSKNVGEAKAGTGILVTLLKKVAPNLLKQVKATKSSAEAFDLAAEAIARTEDPTKQAALASAFFGRAGVKLLPLLKQGRKGLEAYRREMDKYGGAVTGKAIRASEEFKDSQSNLTVAWRALGGVLAVKVLPVVTRLINRLAVWIGKNKELIASKLENFIKRVGAFLSKIDFTKVLAGIERFFDKVSEVSEAIGGWKGALAIVGAFIAGPWLAGILAAVAAIVLAFKGLRGVTAAAGRGLGMVKKAGAAKQDASFTKGPAGAAQARQGGRAQLNRGRAGPVPSTVTRVKHGPLGIGKFGAIAGKLIGRLAVFLTVIEGINLFLSKKQKALIKKRGSGDPYARAMRQSRADRVMRNRARRANAQGILMRDSFRLPETGGAAGQRSGGVDIQSLITQGANALMSGEVADKVSQAIRDTEAALKGEITVTIKVDGPGTAGPASGTTNQKNVTVKAATGQRGTVHK